MIQITYDPYYKDIHVRIGRNQLNCSSSYLNPVASQKGFISVSQGDHTTVRFQISGIFVWITDHTKNNHKFKNPEEAYDWGINQLENLRGKDLLEFYGCLVKAGRNSQ